MAKQHITKAVFPGLIQQLWKALRRPGKDGQQPLYSEMAIAGFKGMLRPIFFLLDFSVHLGISTTFFIFVILP
jgi:hypothetical protein